MFHGVQALPPGAVPLAKQVPFTQPTVGHMGVPDGVFGAPQTPLFGAMVVSLRAQIKKVSGKEELDSGARLPRKLFRKQEFHPLLPTTFTPWEDRSWSEGEA